MVFQYQICIKDLVCYPLSCQKPHMFRIEQYNSSLRLLVDSSNVFKESVAAVQIIIEENDETLV